MSPISKFGVHLDGFYINIGGKKCELRTANTHRFTNYFLNY